MTELDRVFNSDKFNFRGVPSFLQVCEKCSHAMQKKRLNVCTLMVLLHIYSKSLSVRSPVCPVNKHKVLMPIKLLLVYSNVQTSYCL